MPTRMNDVPADVAAAATVGLAGASWFADVGLLLQLLATAVAIGAGLMAAWWHYEKAMYAREERRKLTSENDSVEDLQQQIRALERQIEPLTGPKQVVK